MSAEEDLIIPGPEVKAEIEKRAYQMVERERNPATKMSTEEFTAKLLASKNADRVLYMDKSHQFHKFYLSKLMEYRANPSLVPEAAAPAESTGGKETGAGKTYVAPSTQKDKDREEMYRQAVEEAQRYKEDPFPNRYSLDLCGGTVDLPALTMSVMSCTAQYAAMYGASFVDAVQTRLQSKGFRFLQSDDVRHEVFLKMVESYKCILNCDFENVEDRLERLRSTDYVLNTVCAEKTKYAKAERGRQRAALLTDDILRSKLNWSSFTILREFSLTDLELEGEIPATATRHRNRVEAARAEEDADEEDTSNGDVPADSSGGAGMYPTPPPSLVPTFSPTFMSSNLVRPNDGSEGEKPRHEKRGRNHDGMSAGRQADRNAV